MRKLTLERNVRCWRVRLLLNQTLGQFFIWGRGGLGGRALPCVSKDEQQHLSPFTREATPIFPLQCGSPKLLDVANCPRR